MRRVRLLLAVIFLALTPLSVQAGRLDTALRVAILNENVQMVEDALKNGADINYIEADYADNPLCLAVNTGNMSIVDILLKRGANPNIWIEGNGMITSTPLLKAIALQKMDMIKTLVESGADVNLPAIRYHKPAEKLFSPLMQSIASTYTKDSMDIFNYLLEKGADIYYVTCEGDNALMIVADGRVSVYKQEAAYQMGEILLLKGAKTGIRNKRGKNATDIAIETHFVLMADLLRQKRFANN